VSTVHGDLAERLPFVAGSFDAVMEITAADNLTRRALQDRFWREVARVLKPGGWLLTYHFTPADGYYGPLLKRSPRRALGVLFDRQAGMGFRFYTARNAQTATRGRLRVLCSKHYRYRAPMFGQRPMRDLTAAILVRTGSTGR
jgi:ubiquinone/menaquinone biosynthesis C-methylase UbiE